MTLSLNEFTKSVMARITEMSKEDGQWGDAARDMLADIERMPGGPYFEMEHRHEFSIKDCVMSTLLQSDVWDEGWAINAQNALLTRYGVK